MRSIWSLRGAACIAKNAWKTGTKDIVFPPSLPSPAKIPVSTSHDKKKKKKSSSTSDIEGGKKGEMSPFLAIVVWGVVLVFSTLQQSSSRDVVPSETH